MPFVCDAHVHLYPFYPLENALNAAYVNLSKLAAAEFCKSSQLGENIVLALCLVERSDCHFFRSFIQGSLAQLLPGFTCSPSTESNAMWITLPHGGKLLLFAGRQIVSSERLELLALTSDLQIADGLPFAEAHQLITDSGGVPVLNWAPGKWFFERGVQVRKILNSYAPTELLLGDTTLRPNIWGKPKLMKWAQRRGFRVIAGSDPLPLQGEQKWLGTYALASEECIDLETPVSSLRQLFFSALCKWRIVGRRSTAFEAACRIIANARIKKKHL